MANPAILLGQGLALHVYLRTGMLKTFAVSGLALVGLVGGCVTDQLQTSSTAGRTFDEFKASVYREPGTETYVLDFDTVIRGDEALFEYFAQFQEGALAIDTSGEIGRASCRERV
jgi:hypothetical protein